MAHPAGDLEDEIQELSDDYYASLSLSKTASPEDITCAYRRLSKLYHPDKHIDPINKKDAEVLFNKTKKAYEVLIDPHRRAIYDTLGTSGLETDGWELIKKIKTPQEIREEYEQLKRLQEERRLEQRTNPKGVFTIGVDATDLFESYSGSSSFFNTEISSMTITQSIDAPLTVSDTVTLCGSMSAQNGNGTGLISTSLRHTHSAKTWTEYQLGAGNGLMFSAKAFQNIAKNCFGTIQANFRLKNEQINPSFQAMLGRQLDKHTVGYLTWKAGKQHSMNTTIVWDTSIGHFICTLQCGIPNTFGSISYSHKLPQDTSIKGSVKAGVLGALVEYGVDKKISKHSNLGATVSVGYPTGVVLKLKLSRASQSFVVPISLSHEVLPSSVFYGTAAPIIGWLLLKSLVISPYNERQKKKEAQRARESNASKLNERKKEAASAISLMQETYFRACELERAKGGLIVVQAFYGRLICKETGGMVEDLNSGGSNKIIEVTIPIQCLTKDSRCVLPEGSKSNLPGFYDPCIGEEKQLTIRYTFRNLSHVITIADNELLKIPKESHLVTAM